MGTVEIIKLERLPSSSKMAQGYSSITHKTGWSYLSLREKAMFQSVQASDAGSWPANKPLVPTRTGEAPVLVAQRRR